MRTQVGLLRAATQLARLVPLDMAGCIAQLAGAWIAPRLAGTSHLAGNLARVGVADPGASAARGVGSYGRYWVDTFRLPTLPAAVIDRRFSYSGYDHIIEVQRAGHTPIMVLPHLGSWEWAAAWLGRIAGQHVMAVVERLEPDEVFEWFVDLRQSLGVEIVPLGRAAMGRLVRAATERDRIICLLADRDLGGNGVPVDFFGRRARLPAGPALLSLRTGSPLLPVAIYDYGRTRRCVVEPPIWPERSGSLRRDAAALTQQVADALAALIGSAPHQWHVLSPVWDAQRPDGSQPPSHDTVSS